MNSKTFLLRFAVFIVVCGAGWLGYALAFHALLLTNLLPEQLNGQGFGYAMTYQTAYVYMASILLSFISLFITANWRYILVLAPLYAPPVFAVIFTLMHQPVVTA